MKIKLLTSIAGNGFAYSPGDEIDIEDAEAQRWIKSGIATPTKVKRTATKKPVKETR